MKTLTLSIAALFIAALSTVQAQVSPSSEPRAAVDQSGQVVILPFVPAAVAPTAVAVAANDEDKEPVIRNVSQLRASKMNKKRNGFYTIETNSNWGTNIRMNSYGYDKPTGGEQVVMADGSSAGKKAPAKR